MLAAGCEQYVEDRLLLDVRDLSAFAAGAFDGVVVYGGPISYAFDQAPVALAECIRVTRPGGVVLGRRPLLPDVPVAGTGRDDRCPAMPASGSVRI